MNKKKKYRKVSKKRNLFGNHFGIINILFLIPLIAVSVSIVVKLFNIGNAVTEYKKNTAEIIGTFDYVGVRKSLVGAVVKYSIGNKYYEANIKYYKSSWKKGSKIDIYYNPYNVTEVVLIDDEIYRIFIDSFFEITFIWATFFYDSYEDNLRFKRTWKKSRLYLALEERKRRQ